MYTKQQLIEDIAHAEEKAASLCGDCAKDHARLAYWLNSLLSTIEAPAIHQSWVYNLIENANGDQEKFWFWEDVSKEESERSSKLGATRTLYPHHPLIRNIK